MALPHQNQLAWKISITLVHFVSLSMTMVRIRHRWRTCRIWWDDYIVVIPWAFDCVSTILLWTKYRNRDISWYIPDPEGFVYSKWFDAFVYFTVIWLSRISLTLSVARIFLPGHRYRIYAFVFISILFLMYLTSILITTFSCPGSPWWNLDYTTCVSASKKADTSIIVGVTIDFAADAVLVAAPLCMFWKVKFTKPSDRILILALFASSIITMLAAGAYCAIWYGAARIGSDSKLLFIMMSHLQATLALLVTNLLVVTMMVYRKFRGSDEDPGSQRARARPFSSDAGTATRERRRTGVLDIGDDVEHYTTSVPSYTIASLAPTSAPGSTSVSVPFTSTSMRSSNPESSAQFLESSQVSNTSITLVHFLSLSMTMVRIRHRWRIGRIGRIWWDDYVAVIPWAFDFVSTILLWTKYKNRDISWYIPDPQEFVYSIWFDGFVYFTTLWFSRICLTLSVVPIFLPGHRYRIYGFIFIAVLFLLYLTNVFIMTFVCPGSPWWNLDYTLCVSGSKSADASVIIGVIMDFGSDAILVAAPLFIFWKVKFPRQSDRILILVLFANSVITMMTTGMFCAVWYASARIGPDSKLLFIMMCHLQVEFPREMHIYNVDSELELGQATLALLVTNLLVVTMMVYRKFRGSDEDSESQRAGDRPFDSDAGTATRERRRTGVLDTGDDVEHYTTSVPSYTIASFTLTSAPGSMSTSVPFTSIYTSTSMRSSDPESSGQFLESSQVSDSNYSLSRVAYDSNESRHH
ncbi:hypothetical protein CVT25_006345 [Psilocybe cyanescens]|uniref:Rhodopsin domain-containing protein n=1 Tax=Psilocybe cyanescens TaxID=93625 RepID=A0A409WYK0_PSICY|nr:hypothetical protein CVT25_006345 [Psilocybe cyanescens]